MSKNPLAEKKGKPVWVKEETVIDLEGFKEHPRESYDDVIRKLIAFKRAHADCAKEVGKDEKTDDAPEPSSIEGFGRDGRSGQAGNEGTSG